MNGVLESHGDSYKSDYLTDLLVSLAFLFISFFFVHLQIGVY